MCRLFASLAGLVGVMAACIPAATSTGSATLPSGKAAGGGSLHDTLHLGEPIVRGAATTADGDVRLTLGTQAAVLKPHWGTRGGASSTRPPARWVLFQGEPSYGLVLGEQPRLVKLERTTGQLLSWLVPRVDTAIEREALVELRADGAGGEDARTLDLLPQIDGRETVTLRIDDDDVVVTILDGSGAQQLWWAEAFGHADVAAAVDVYRDGTGLALRVAYDVDLEPDSDHSSDALAHTRLLLWGPNRSVEQREQSELRQTAHDTGWSTWVTQEHSAQRDQWTLGTSVLERATTSVSIVNAMACEDADAELNGPCCDYELRQDHVRQQWGWLVPAGDRLPLQEHETNRHVLKPDACAPRIKQALDDGRVAASGTMLFVPRPAVQMALADATKLCADVEPFGLEGELPFRLAGWEELRELHASGRIENGRYWAVTSSLLAVDNGGASAPALVWLGGPPQSDPRQRGAAICVLGGPVAD